jgi:hypothetical protein
MSDEPVKVLRPGDAYLGGHGLPERNEDAKQKSVATLNPDFEAQYNAMSASDALNRYKTDPAFAVQVDLLLERKEPQ